MPGAVVLVALLAAGQTQLEQPAAEPELLTPHEAAEEPAPADDNVKAAPAAGLSPMAWALIGVVSGTAVGVLLALPFIILYFAVGVVQAALAFSGTTPAALPWLQTAVSVPVNTLYNLACFYAVCGVVPAGLTAGAVTVLGAAFQGRRKLPWIPTLAVTTLPKLAGCTLGVCAWLVLDVAGYTGIVAYALATGGLTGPGFGRAFAHPAVWAVMTGLSLMCPVAVFGGSLAGDLATLGLFSSLNANRGRDLEPDEPATPRDMMDATRSARQDARAEEELADDDEE